jgi:hypothetical protein
MKYILISVLALFSSAAMAQSIQGSAFEMSCPSTQSSAYSAYIEFNEKGLIKRIATVSDEEMYDVYSEEKLGMKRAGFVMSRAELTKIDFWSAMAALSEATGEYETATIQVVVLDSANTSDAEAVARELEDDAAGFAYLSLYDKQGRRVGTSLLSAWAGIFNRCQ